MPPEGGVGWHAGPGPRALGSGDEAACSSLHGAEPAPVWEALRPHGAPGPVGSHSDPRVWGQAAARGAKNGGSGCCTQGEQGTLGSVPGPTWHTEVTQWSHLGFMQILKVKSNWRWAWGARERQTAASHAPRGTTGGTTAPPERWPRGLGLGSPKDRFRTSGQARCDGCCSTSSNMGRAPPSSDSCRRDAAVRGAHSPPGRRTDAPPWRRRCESRGGLHPGPAPATRGPARSPVQFPSEARSSDQASATGRRVGVGGALVAGVRRLTPPRSRPGAAPTGPEPVHADGELPPTFLTCWHQSSKSSSVLQKNPWNESVVSRRWARRAPGCTGAGRRSCPEGAGGGGPWRPCWTLLSP